MAARVSVVIVNYKGYEDTVNCLQSLEKLSYKNFDSIVVDNRSDQKQVARLRKRFPKTKFMPSNENLGFTGGNNLGIKAALRNKADYVFLLNNDTAIEKDCLTKLVQAMEKNGKLGVIGPQVLNYFDKKKIENSGSKISWLKERVAGVPLSFAEVIPSREKNSGLKETEIVYACALMARAKTLEEVGLMDEQLFLLHEEDDLCRRARKQGWQCFVHNEAKVYHKGQSSFKKEAGIKAIDPSQNKITVYYWHRNWMYYLKKHYGWREFAKWFLVYYFNKVPHRLRTMEKQGMDCRELKEAYDYAFLDALTGRMPKRFVEP
jgi:GT2 family glycosyltransferase